MNIRNIVCCMVALSATTSAAEAETKRLACAVKSEATGKTLSYGLDVSSSRMVLHLRSEAPIDLKVLDLVPGAFVGMRASADGGPDVFELQPNTMRATVVDRDEDVLSGKCHESVSLS